jgi:UDP:flavonoid glycosyltransferase YjiC (YdhE family)
LNVRIATFGSRGDTQPQLALAPGLQRAGHRPRLVAPRDLAAWIESYGVEVRPVPFNIAEFMRSPEIAALRKGRHPARRLRTVRNAMDALVGGALDETLEASRDADFLVLPITAFGGADIAARRGPRDRSDRASRRGIRPALTAKDGTPFPFGRKPWPTQRCTARPR